MPKRRAAVDSDSDELSAEASQASKRARTTENSDDEQDITPYNSQPQPNRDIKGKSKARRNANTHTGGDGDEEEDVEQTAPDEDEEKRFEEEHEEEIRAKVLNKSKAQQGGIAEMGIIEKLEMHQFMCHKYLTFTFGPQINFIIGHNGSGKSAVLSALTVALGGKATTTGRGSGLKSFIREGQNASEVSVTIKNQGEEAYKHKEYGDSIVITRRFTREGSSSYKIKSKDGKVISTKREELSAICDHMNIQVDNPMNILTQDSARQFLSASQPTDKYKFFLRGTQLSQLSEEYSTCLENITQTQKVLLHKSEAIPDLEEALADATARFQEAAKAREQRHKADELKKELAWSYVVAKENELRAKVEEHTKAEARLPRIKEALEEAQERLKQETAKVGEYEEELNDLGEIEHLHEELKRNQEKIRENKTKLNEYRSDEKQMNQSLQQLNKQIDSMNKQITEQQRKIEEQTQGKRDETNRRLQEAQADFQKAEDNLKGIKERRQALEAELESIKAKGIAATADRTRIRENITNGHKQLDRCDEREKNKLAPFGRNMDAVLADIQRTQWHGQIPLGPFGLYVQVKDPAKWALIMRAQLGNMMNSWAITDPRDRGTLDRILKHRGNDRIGIIITEKDLFDYQSGEPPEQFLTVLRALDISDPFVLRILINQVRIESIFLAPTRKEADEILLSYGRGGLAWAADFYRVQRFPEGGGQSNPLQDIRKNRGDSRHQLFTGNDVTAERTKWQDELQKAEARHAELNNQIEEYNQTYRKHGVERDALVGQERQAYQQVKDAKLLRDALQDEANEELPSDIIGLQDTLTEFEEEKESIKTQFAEVQIKKKAVDDAQHPLMAESERIKKEIDEFEGRRSAITKKIEDAVADRIKAQTAENHYKGKLEIEQKKVDDIGEVVKQLQEEFATWTAKAQAYCDRYPNPRKTEVVQRNLESVQNALKEREKKHGASVEEMTVEVNKKKAALDTAKRELKNMMTLNKALRKSIKVRLRKWHEFRRHIALRCKIYFQYHLSNRGYYGKVLFDHVAGTLQLKVQTDDQTSTQSSREKDPRSLSGGEKSFSTICLLLSLWESIGCPIRCLDEFDVFMDAVNRRISMKMMIDTANASNRKQYILITPQDMTNITIGNSVRVHRMSDPERGQGVLAFQ